jgi:hypothetical protein
MLREVQLKPTGTTRRFWRGSPPRNTWVDLNTRRLDRHPTAQPALTPMAGHEFTTAARSCPATRLRAIPEWGCQADEPQRLDGAGTVGAGLFD